MTVPGYGGDSSNNIPTTPTADSNGNFELTWGYGSVAMGYIIYAHNNSTSTNWITPTFTFKATKGSQTSKVTSYDASTLAQSFF